MRIPLQLGHEAVARGFKVPGVKELSQGRPLVQHVVRVNDENTVPQPDATGEWGAQVRFGSRQNAWAHNHVRGGCSAPSVPAFSRLSLLRLPLPLSCLFKLCGGKERGLRGRYAPRRKKQ